MYRVNFRFLRLLYLFVVVAETKNFSKAAQLLCMSQPPLSQSIKELEEEIGYSLFERKSRGVELTAAGKTLLPIVNRFISEAELVNYSVKNLKADNSSVLNIGSVHDGMMHVVPYIRQKIAEQDSRINVFTKEIDTVEIPQLILSEEVDFCIGYLLNTVSSDLTIREICTVKLKAAVPASSNLAKKQRVTWKELSKERLVVIGREATPQYYDHLLSFFLNKELQVKIQHTVNSVSRQLGFINCGQGIGIVPEWETKISPSEVKIIDIEDDSAFIPLNCCWRTNRDNAPMRIFLSALEQIKNEELLPL